MSSKSVNSAPDGLTTMVRHWPEQPNFGPKPTLDQRTIRGGAIYVLEEIRKALGADDVAFIGNDEYHYETELNWDNEDAWNAVCSLQDKHYSKSLWCEAVNGFWLRTDVYTIRNYDDGYDPPRLFELYLKFGMSNNGKRFLIISCHPSTG